MKRLILMCVVLFTTNSILQAQTTGGQSTNGPTYTREGYNKKTKKKTANLNHRKNYNWKTGQQATPTGQEATGTGSNSFQSLKKDTAGKRED